jgi:hypothetical protein
MVYSVEQLYGVRDGLANDKARVTVETNAVIAEFKRLSSPDNKRKYSDGYLGEKFSQVRKHASEVVTPVYEAAMKNADAALEQEAFWTPMHVISRARLLPPPAKIKLTDSGLMLESEKQMRTIVVSQMDLLSEIAENTTRTRLLADFEAMDNRTFSSRLDEAVADSDAASIFILGMAANKRGGPEGEKLQEECRKAVFTVKLPEREQAADLMLEIRILKNEIANLAEGLIQRGFDLKSWVNAIKERVASQERKEQFVSTVANA